ncbi:iron-containing redox enzyme family protein [Streptomyces luteolus]|uniref:Iron-containing redox enzyme family protein n=1 Tax=Streptomyces luteolus TaxID=3043615 RepID=A0ABT6SW76_9ACTN|nr:iron-containing redox enzyme family protein [Streptomyces sp. B-S-A12]MDI3419853.1 iron-containing redox enzyme family protein [Streptomyces sp. B-S-A12]
MSDDLALERIPPRDGVLRPAADVPEGSVESLLNDALRGPVEPLDLNSGHRSLLAALDEALRRGRADGDAVALLDAHRSAYTVYEGLLGHPLGIAAHERSSWLNAFRWKYEEAVLRADTGAIADRLPDRRDAMRPEFVRDWFLTEAKERTALDRRVETHLAERATVEQLALFIQADGYLNYRFYDALVLAQPHFMETVKHEISRHLWDECGEGERHRAHTLQFTRSLQTLGLSLPTVPPWEDWRPYAGHNLYFVLACNRRNHFKALGSLAMPELFDVDRDAAVVSGLERHGYGAERDFEFFHNHMEGDAEHGPEWLDGVILPIVEAEPEAGIELITGGALRMLAMRRYNEYLAALLDVTGTVSGTVSEQPA